MVVSNWEEWQQRWQPRLTLPGKVEGQRLSVRMRASAGGADEGSRRVLLYFSGQVDNLERIKAPIFYQSVAGGAIIGLIVGLVLGVMV